MDYIKDTLKSLIKENPEWINELTAYPYESTKLTTDEQEHYKGLTSYKECKTEKTYKIIKKLIQTQRSIHPAWFFILSEYFENDNFLFEEEIINNINIINFFVLNDFKMIHSIQIITTLKMYYSLIRNSKISECFLKKRSEFTKKYTEFKTVWKNLFFPSIEMRDPQKFAIDLSYKFNNTNIHIEINEPHHKKDIDKERENTILFITGKRIVHFYISKNELDKDKDTIDIITRINNCINKDLSTVIDSIFYRMTETIYNSNEYAGLVFYTFSQDLIDNLSTAILFNELKVLSNNRKLTWNLFCEKCSNINIILTNDDLNKIKTKLQTINNKDKLKNKLDEMFYNCKTLNEICENSLLRETGFDYILMRLEPENTNMCLDITIIYAKYKQAHDKIMTQLFKQAKEDQTIIKTQSEKQYNSLFNKFNELKKMFYFFERSMINSDLSKIKG